MTWQPGDPVHREEVSKVNVCPACGTSWTADIEACPFESCTQAARDRVLPRRLDENGNLTLCAQCWRYIRAHDEAQFVDCLRAAAERAP